MSTRTVRASFQLVTLETLKQVWSCAKCHKPSDTASHVWKHPSFIEGNKCFWSLSLILFTTSHSFFFGRARWSDPSTRWTWKSLCLTNREVLCKWWQESALNKLNLLELRGFGAFEVWWILWFLFCWFVLVIECSVPCVLSNSWKLACYTREYAG